MLFLCSNEVYHKGCWFLRIPLEFHFDSSNSFKVLTSNFSFRKKDKNMKWNFLYALLNKLKPFYEWFRFLNSLIDKFLLKTYCEKKRFYCYGICNIFIFQSFMHFLLLCNRGRTNFVWQVNTCPHLNVFIGEKSVWYGSSIYIFLDIFFKVSAQISRGISF